ncbi:hypothetical protein AGABI2DRAFT_203651 [Agaricus bisporus var. bisporus H97]|uniref:hypothetical protein n=1 Tax=Agaricus bisporus var. bisporus (strain H97 / ATCC MYA-4626 / FGSC 10389) TaxID=936046 RepID=UPI00029F6F71|nr:hypothetical protein AGABI2DRAFT_203651 [Agaricus bisporus var. bisporus H97]EKV48705.1 hypothetical protein AGABI2DRAFT_203651 [Agaricus bisporus var. bisporus H97]
MIIEKPLPIDPTPSEAPPAYDSITLGSQRSPLLDLKSPTPSGPSTSTSPSSPPSTLSKYPTSSASSSTAKGKGKVQWFNFPSKTSKDVKATTLGLIRDLVREDFQTTAAFGILQSCAEACKTNGVSLASILQEMSIEGHTPLYWAIVKRRPDDRQDDSTQIPDLLTSLLSFSTPLSSAAVADIRHACLITSDQPLFQRLRQSPDFNSGSATDEMLIGVTLPPDDVEVIDLPDDEGSFAVNFGVVKFQKRMMISKSISIEFIARGRMWQLRFFVEPEDSRAQGRRPGSWCVSLSLMEHSPPTWIDSQLLIAEPRILKDGKSSKRKPTITMRLSSTSPLTPRSTYRGAGITEVVVTFEDIPMATSLQYSESSYIALDEKLRGRLEARLAKQEHDCIIC